MKGACGPWICQSRTNLTFASAAAGRGRTTAAAEARPSAPVRMKALRVVMSISLRGRLSCGTPSEQGPCPARGGRSGVYRSREPTSPTSAADGPPGSPTLWATERKVNMAAAPIIARMMVGASVRRRDAADKLTGRARYVDDLSVPGMLHGRTVRSAVARGRLERIEFDPAVPWDEIVVVTAADVPGTNRVKLIDLEQPFLVERATRHREEPVVLLAHEDREVLARAARGVRRS